MRTGPAGQVVSVSGTRDGRQPARWIAPRPDPRKLASSYLAPRGVTLDLFEAAGGEVVADASRLDPMFPREPAIAFRFRHPLTGESLAYTDQDGRRRALVRIRRLREELRTDEAKFLQPRGSGTHVYFASLAAMEWRKVFADTSYGLVISEGETRALSGAECDLPVIALTGVDCGQINGKLHPELLAVAWKGRDVYLAFDSDLSHKRDVQRALQRLARLLGERGAIVWQVRLPATPDGAKQGFDDYLARYGRGAFESLLRSPETVRMEGGESFDEPIPLADLMATDYPPTEWVWADFVLKGEVNLLYGDGGVGKSLLALYLGLAVAGGRRLFGADTIQMPVEALFAEDSPGQVQHRVQTARAALGIEVNANLPMRLWCQPRGDTTLARIDDNGVVTELPALEALREQLATAGRSALVILDSFADLFALNESLRLPVNAALKKVLGALCRDFGATILVLAHPSKSSMQDGTNYSGSTAFNNAVRQRLNLEIVKPEKSALTEGMPWPRRLSVAKSNYGMPAEKALFYYGAAISEVPQGPVFTTEDAKKAVLDAVLGMIDKGICVVRGNGSGQKPADIVVAVKDRLGLSLSVQQVREHLASLERDGMLAYRPSDRSRHKSVPATFVRGANCQ